MAGCPTHPKKGNWRLFCMCASLGFADAHWEGQERWGQGLYLYICLQSQGRFYTRRGNLGLCKERACFSLRWELQLDCQLASSRLCYRANTHAGSRGTESFCLCCLLPVTVRSLPESEATHTTLRLWSARSPSSRALGELTGHPAHLASQPIWPSPRISFSGVAFRDLYDHCCVCVFWEPRHNSFQPAFVHSLPKYATPHHLPQAQAAIWNVTSGSSNIIYLDTLFFYDYCVSMF